MGEKQTETTPDSVTQPPHQAAHNPESVDPPQHPQALQPCETCKGTGLWEYGEQRGQCVDCNGTGEVIPDCSVKVQEGRFKNEVIEGEFYYVYEADGEIFRREVNGGGVYIGRLGEDDEPLEVLGLLDAEARHFATQPPQQVVEGPDEAAKWKHEPGEVGNRELDVEGHFCGAHHIGGTTWRFGSGDLCDDPSYGCATLDGFREAMFVVAAIDNAVKESRAIHAANQSEQVALGDGELRETVEGVVSNFNAVLNGVSDIENEVGGGLDGLRQAHGLMISALQAAFTDLAASLEHNPSLGDAQTDKANGVSDEPRDATDEAKSTPTQEADEPGDWNAKGGAV